MKKLFGFIFVSLVCAALHADPISFVQVRRTLQPGTTNQGVFVGSGTIQNLTASTITARIATISTATITLINGSSATITTVNGSTASFTRYLSSGGAVAAPAYSSFINPALGMYFGPTTIGLGAPTGGDIELRINSVQIYDMNGSSIVIQKPIQSNALGGISIPDFSFFTDPSTGYHRRGAGNTEIVGSGTSLAVFATTGTAILGTTSNNSAEAGFVGETLSTFTVRSSPVSLSNGVSKNIFQYTLQAGDYNAFVQCGFGGTGVSTALDCGLATTSATLPGADVIAVPTSNQGRTREPGLSVATADATLSIYVPIRINSPTIFYLVSNCEFPSGTCTAYGSILFRRAR